MTIFSLVKTVKILFYYLALSLLSIAFSFSFLESASNIVEGSDCDVIKTNTELCWYNNKTDEPISTSITEIVPVCFSFQNSYKGSKSDFYNRINTFSLLSNSIFKRSCLSFSFNSSIRSNSGFYYLNLRKLLI